MASGQHKSYARLQVSIICVFEQKFSVFVVLRMVHLQCMKHIFPLARVFSRRLSGKRIYIQMLHFTGRPDALVSSSILHDVTSQKIPSRS